MIFVDRLTPPHPRNDLGPRYGNLAAFVVDEICDGGFLTDFHASQSTDEEIGVEVLAAELAVGDRLQPDLLLLRDNPPDGHVFGSAELLCGNFPSSVIIAELLKLGGTQQAAHVIRSKAWYMWSGNHYLSRLLRFSRAVAVAERQLRRARLLNYG